MSTCQVSHSFFLGEVGSTIAYVDDYMQCVAEPLM